MDTEMIDVPFVARGPTADDYWAVGAFLRQLFGRSIEDFAGFADQIVALEDVTTIVKAEEDVQVLEKRGKAKGKDQDQGAKKAKKDSAAAAAATAVAASATGAAGEGKKESAELTEEDLAEDARYNSYAMATAINLHSVKDAAFAKQLIAWLGKSTTGAPYAHKLEAALAAPTTALVIVERFVNMPMQLAVPLYETLAAAIQEQQTGTKAVVMVVKLYEETTDDKPAGKKAKRQRKKRADDADDDDDENDNKEGSAVAAKAGSGKRECACAEDTYFLNVASFRHDVQVEPTQQPDSADLPLMYRAILLLPYDAFERAIKKLAKDMAVNYER